MKHCDKIMIVEDDAGIRHYLQSTLSNAGYDTVAVGDGRSALALAASHCPDCVLLDLGLPDMDGIGIIQSIRKWSSVPIIVISARMTEDDKAGALDLGADDYITKPFGMMEFISRVKAVLRRGGSRTEETLVHGPIQIRIQRHEVLVHGQKVELTLKEFELLKYLVENRGIVLTRDQLLTRIWGYDFDGETRTVDVHVRTLRQKLGEAGACIETVRGVGYRMGDEA